MTTATATELELLVMAPVAMEDDAVGGDDADEAADPLIGDDEDEDEAEEGEDKDEEAA